MDKPFMFGSYLIFPLKYEDRKMVYQKINGFTEPVFMKQGDLTETVRTLFEYDVSNQSKFPRVGSCHHLKRGALLDFYFKDRKDDGCTFAMKAGKESFRFDFEDSYFFIFNTNVAFFCLGIVYDTITALEELCMTGTVDREHEIEFFRMDNLGQTEEEFSFEDKLNGLLSLFYLRNFFSDSRPLVETFLYNMSVFPSLFRDLQEMERLSFHIHKRLPFDVSFSDPSESDIKYVYGVLDESVEDGRYWWGCCITSQDINYIRADPDNDGILDEMEDQHNNGLPMVVIALYEKYTCLRFSEYLLKIDEKSRSKEIRYLKTLMLEFKAFGVVTPANISRWHNVSEIYSCLLENSAIPEAIDDISEKLEVLSDREEKANERRSDKIMNLITVFGIVQIIDSVLSIYQMLSDGNMDKLVLLLSMFSLITVLSFFAIRHFD